MDIFSNISPIIIWTILGVILIIVEMFSVTFFILPLGIGALITALLSAVIKLNFVFQLLIFFLASAGFMFLFQYYIKPKMRQQQGQKTNIDRLIGLETKLLEKISDNTPGKIRIEGKTWRVKADNEIAQGEKVIVTKIEGVTLTVIKKEN